MPEYKQIRPEPGRWYVSDTGPIRRRTPDTIVKPSHGGAHHMIFSGPHETKTEAENWAVEFEEREPNYKGRTYIWQAQGR